MVNFIEWFNKIKNDITLIIMNQDWLENNVYSCLLLLERETILRRINPLLDQHASHLQEEDLITQCAYELFLEYESNEGSSDVRKTVDCIAKQIAAVASKKHLPHQPDLWIEDAYLVLVWVIYCTRQAGGIME